MTAALHACLAAIAMTFLAAPAAAQSYRCTGEVNGVASESAIEFERTPNTIFVAGVIENANARYTFNGQMFGGNEGYIAMVEQPSNQRIDRVYIALTPSGFAIRPENGPLYEFSCS